MRSACQSSMTLLFLFCFGFTFCSRCGKGWNKSYSVLSAKLSILSLVCKGHLEPQTISGPLFSKEMFVYFVTKEVLSLGHPNKMFRFPSPDRLIFFEK